MSRKKSDDYVPVNFKFEVQLDLLPPMIIEAETKHDAIESYFKWNGILSTENKVNVKLIEDEPVN